MMKVRATQLGFHGLERRYPAEDKHANAGHAFEIEDYEFSLSWMEPVGISFEEAAQRAKAAREERKAAAEKDKFVPKKKLTPGKKKTAAERAQAGEPVAISELTPDEVSPAGTVDRDVI